MTPELAGMEKINHRWKLSTRIQEWVPNEEDRAVLFCCDIDLGAKNLSFFFFLGRVSLCCPGWCAVAQAQLTADSASLVQVILLPQHPK